MGDIAFDPTSLEACPVLMSSDGGVFFNTKATSPDCQTPVWDQPTITPHGLWLFGMAGAHGSSGTGESVYFGAQDNGTFASTNAETGSPVWSNRDCCDSFDASATSSQVLTTTCCFRPGRADRMFLRGEGMTGGGEETY
jgi:hypothetical protein